MPDASVARPDGATAPDANNAASDLLAAAKPDATLSPDTYAADVTLSPDVYTADVPLSPDTYAADVPLFADTYSTNANDGSASDLFNITQTDALAIPDTLAGSDVVLSGDVGTLSDAPLGEDSFSPRLDLAGPADGSSTIASTTTPDDSTDPITCATVKLGDRNLSADQAYDIVMPDCLRLSGTVTLDSPLPSGAVFSNGSVHAFKVIRDANNQVIDNISYAAATTAVDDTHFRYSVGVPAGTYEVMYYFALKSAGQIPSVASRIGQERITVGQSIKHDVTLPAMDVATYTVTVTGTDALASNGNAFGRMIEVVGMNDLNTLMVVGVSMTSGASIPITMWIPRETITPTILVHESPSAMSPYVGGKDSQFKLDKVTPAADFSLALPDAVKISGTVSDPYQMLSPMMGAGGAGSSATSYYQCDPLDTGTFPDPIFMYPEGSVSTYFSASTAHAFYARKGLTCVLSADYAIATGTSGATPTRAGENTFAYMMDPTPRSPDGITLTEDITRNVIVPNLGPQVTVTGTVKDARGAAIPNANLSFNSRSLTTVSVADKTFVGSLDVSSSGSYTLHALPGLYTMSIALPSSTATGTTTTPDAGVTNQDAAPDVGFGGDCTTLAACCSTLSGSTQSTCNTLVSTNNTTTCASYLALFKLAGSCQ